MAIKTYTQEELNKATEELNQNLQKVTVEKTEALAKIVEITSLNTESAAKIAELTEVNENLENSNKVLQSANVELQKKVSFSSVNVNGSAEKSKPTIPTDAVVLDGKEYEFTCPTFRIPGEDEPNTAEQALTDEKLVAKILAIEGQGILKEIL